MGNRSLAIRFIIPRDLRVLVVAAPGQTARDDKSFLELCLSAIILLVLAYMCIQSTEYIFLQTAIARLSRLQTLEATHKNGSHQGQLFFSEKHHFTFRKKIGASPAYIMTSTFQYIGVIRVQIMA